MADIFISYASDDRSRVEPLAKALADQGWSVWWDRTIPPGKTFDQVIQEAITAAKCVVVLWSKQSIISDWVKEEATIGKRRQILVPAKIDAVDPPLGFGMIQAADLVDWQTDKSHSGFLSLLSAISEIVGSQDEIDKSAQVAEHSESKESEKLQPDLSHLKPAEKKVRVTDPKAPRKKRLAFGIGAVALILVLSVIGWFFFSKSESNNTTASLDSRKINEIILLDTQSSSMDAEIKGLEQYGVSYHYLISRSGEIKILVNEEDIASHTKGRNSNSIGIGLMHISGESYPESQLKSLVELLSDIIIRWNMDINNIIPNSQIPPKKKSDIPDILNGLRKQVQERLITLKETSSNNRAFDRARTRTDTRATTDK